MTHKFRVQVIGSLVWEEETKGVMFAEATLRLQFFFRRAQACSFPNKNSRLRGSSYCFYYCIMSLVSVLIFSKSFVPLCPIPPSLSLCFHFFNRSLHFFLMLQTLQNLLKLESSLIPILLATTISFLSLLPPFIFLIASILTYVHIEFLATA